MSESIEWQNIGLVKSKNHSNVEIGKLVGVSEFCVRKTVKAWELTGDVVDMTRSGRPSKLVDRDKSSIFRTSKENPRFSKKS